LSRVAADRPTDAIAPSGKQRRLDHRLGRLRPHVLEPTEQELHPVNENLGVRHLSSELVGGKRPLKSDIMSGMQIIRAVIFGFAVSAVALATSACPEKGPAEKAGEKIDNAVDKTKDAAKDATK
jgi:hypothetical protein